MDAEPPEPGSPTLRVDCDTCVMRNTDACADCLVTYLCRGEPEAAVVITMEELRAMRTLAEGGLVPGLRHRTSATGEEGTMMGA